MSAQTIFEKYAAEAGDIAMKPSEALALINFTLEQVATPLETEIPEEDHEDKKPKKHKK